MSVLRESFLAIILLHRVSGFSVVLVGFMLENYLLIGIIGNCAELTSRYIVVETSLRKIRFAFLTATKIIFSHSKFSHFTIYYM